MHDNASNVACVLTPAAVRKIKTERIMKTKFTLFFITFTLFGWSYNSKLSAQDKNKIAYYRTVSFTCDTIFNKPNSNRIELNVGGQADVNGDASGVNSGIYGYGRIRIPHFMFSGLVAMAPGTNYGVEEATVVFCFKGSSEKKAGSTAVVATTDVGTERKKFKTGGTIKYISPQAWTSKTVEYNGPNGTSNNNIRGDATTKTTTTKSGMSNAKHTVKAITYLEVPKYTVSGLSVGAFHWDRPNSISGIAHVTGMSLGLVASINSKAKYRFHYTEKVNDVKILGLGNYITTPTDKIRKTGTKIGKYNSTIDVGLELLYAPMVQFEQTQYFVKSATDTVGHLQDVKKKNFGFRIRSEIRKGPISMRFEVGLRPGVKAKVGGAAGEDNFATRMMGGAYVLFGVGIGLGVW
ncbi:MAG TPA: hypothetical protein VF411_07680 [Bacteroidia bacterium]